VEKKFMVPAGFFLGPVFIWIAAMVGYSSWFALSAPFSVGLFFILGVLILFSGVSCQKAGGPRMGNIIRSCVLLVLALLTWWKAGVAAGAAMLLSAVALGILAVLGRYSEQE
jgi:hypothetical protein